MSVFECVALFLPVQIFGCYVSSAWRVHDSYFGLGTCFVFTLHPSFKVFPASGANQFFQLANNSAMALGGGDNFAIWIDEALRKGTSKHCDTFASPSLSSEEEFRCNGPNRTVLWTRRVCVSIRGCTAAEAHLCACSVLSLPACACSDLEVWSFVDGQW